MNRGPDTENGQLGDEYRHEQAGDWTDWAHNETVDDQADDDSEDELETWRRLK